MTSKPKLHIVSNRLPIVINHNVEEDTYDVTPASGGLVTALAALKKDVTFSWVGWPGSEFNPIAEKVIREKLANEHGCIPVFLPDRLAVPYYSGFANGIIWPLCHYHPGEFHYQESEWIAYQKVNEIFADTVVEGVQDGDSVWIQDYQLMLLPALVRERLAKKGLHDVKIGFFSHIPFPSSEVYRILPTRAAILKGMLASDLVGFQTYDYARHFLSSCTRILGLPTTPNGVEYEARTVHVGTYAIGIDPTKFMQAVEKTSVQARIHELRQRINGRKVYVGVDRLDYTKGVPNKLLGFQEFLRIHPELRSKVVLIQVAVPTRIGVEDYKTLIQSTNELVGRINGLYGGLDYVPIHYINQSVNFEELVALYAAADVCVVSSTRDGMNLVSYEFIASQTAGHGALVLSEFAGAAQSLNGAILFNPWGTEELSQALYDAYTLTDEARKQNHEKLFRYVEKHTAANWGSKFVADLHNLVPSVTRRLPRTNLDTLLSKWQNDGKKKVIFLDCDGTLTHLNRPPKFAKPSDDVLETLKSLSNLPDTLVFILSGRDRAHLIDWFDGKYLGLVAEHGCFYRHPNAPEWHRLAEDYEANWRADVRPLFQHYTDRTPGSFIEEKEVNLTWHYLNADIEFGAWQAAQLQMNLEGILCHLPVSIVHGTKTLELRPSSVDKTSAVRAILNDVAGSPQRQLDKDLFSDGRLKDVTSMILAIGDGKTDEPVFQALQSLPQAVTVTVGKKRTAAMGWVEDVSEVQSLLKEFADGAACK